MLFSGQMQVFEIKIFKIDFYCGFEQQERKKHALFINDYKNRLKREKIYLIHYQDLVKN